jgi:hypothetical protein
MHQIIYDQRKCNTIHAAHSMREVKMNDNVRKKLLKTA